MAQEIGHAGRCRPKAGPTIDLSEHMGVQWPALFFVVMREKLRLIGRDIDVRWAFGFARFTRQAEIKRLFDVLIVPAITQHFALQQFEEHMSAPSRAVFLLSRGHVARTHGATIIFPACSEPY